MSFGSTKALHYEASGEHQAHSIWALVEAQKAKAAGRCDLARDYAFSAFDAAAKASAHVVAQHLSRRNEQGAVKALRERQAAARRIIESCVGK